MSGYEMNNNVSWSSSPSSSCRFKRAIVMPKTTPPPRDAKEKEVPADRLKEVTKAVAVSKELLQLLRSAWDQRSVRSSLFSALRLELERALVLAAAEEQWSRGERDRTRLAVAAEVRAERRLRRQAERLNRRLGSELADARAAAERERRVRQLVERQMLQEEGVQMKLSDAEYELELEEKNAAVEQLRCDLQACLTAGPSANDNCHSDIDGDGDEDDDIIIVNNDHHHLRFSPEKVQWSDICFNGSINQ